MEDWKAIVGFEGIYEVSSEGTIRSLDREVHHKYGGTSKLRGSKRKLWKDKNGYLCVDLSKEDKIYKMKAHRVVAEAFLIPDEERDCVNHIDANKSNNRVDNLEWVTRKENSQHAAKLGAFSGAVNPKAGKLTVEQVLEIRRLREEDNWSYGLIALQMGITHSNVFHIVKRKTWKEI